VDQKNINDWLIPILVAVAGGMSDFLLSDEHTWKYMLINLFLAGFAGYLTLALCIEYGVSDSWTGVLCGISGLSSRALLVGLRKYGSEALLQRFRNGGTG